MKTSKFILAGLIVAALGSLAHAVPTTYIQNRQTLQTGTTFYVSSGTVETQFGLNGTLAINGSKGTAGQMVVSNGSSADISWGSGRILQIVPFSNSVSSQTTLNTFINSTVTGTITPLSAGSTIYIVASIQTDTHISATNSTGIDLKWKRGSSATSGGYVFGSVNAHGSGTSIADDQWIQVPILDYDFPATTSSTIYTLQFRNSQANSLNVYVNENSFGGTSGATSNGFLIEFGP